MIPRGLYGPPRPRYNRRLFVPGVRSKANNETTGERMQTTRREFLRTTALGAATAAVMGFEVTRVHAAVAALEAQAGIRIGGCDWSLGKEGDPAAFAVAKAAGLDGVEVSCGKGKSSLPISDPEKQAKLLAAAKASGLPIPSSCLEILHRDGLKEHEDAPKWVKEAIEPTRKLGGKVILLPSFGKQAIEKRSEQEAVAERLKPIAPLAEKAGIILGLENTISAKDNAFILEKIGSPAVKVYYDVGNSFNYKHDIYSEIAFLGKDRVAQIHLKDRGYLGQGKIDFPRFLETVVKSGFTGWMMLETNIVKTAEEDFATNSKYVREVLKEKGKAG
jgi:L-ribulose-5-phosphate 3-epimerase